MFFSPISNVRSDTAPSVETVVAEKPEEDATASNNEEEKSNNQASSDSPVSLLFAKPSGQDDIIVRSSDMFDFHVNKSILHLSSPNLASLQPNSEGVLVISEQGYILDILLTMLYPVEPRTWTSLDGFSPVLDLALKYNVVCVVETLRRALISPRRIGDKILPSFVELDPLRVFAIARSSGLEPEAQLAARETLRMSLHSSQMSAEVENMPTKFYRELITLRDDKGAWRDNTMARLFRGSRKPRRSNTTDSILTAKLSS